MREIANILKISKSAKLLVKMKKMTFILWKKTQTDFLANPIIAHGHRATRQKAETQTQEEGGWPLIHTLVRHHLQSQDSRWGMGSPVT